MLTKYVHTVGEHIMDYNIMLNSFTLKSMYVQYNVGIYILKRKTLFLILKWTLLSMRQLSAWDNQEAKSNKHMRNTNCLDSRHREVQIVIHSLFTFLKAILFSWNTCLMSFSNSYTVREIKGDGNCLFGSFFVCIKKRNVWWPLRIKYSNQNF